MVGSMAEYQVTDASARAQRRFLQAFRHGPVLAAALLLGACAQLIPVLEPEVAPADTQLSKTLSAVNAGRAYELGYSGSEVTVAVIDTGASVNSELSGVIHPNSFSVVTNTDNIHDSSGHGTAVAGVIAAADDSNGLQGIAFDASLLIVKADDASGRFTAGSLRRALQYAVDRGAPIINMSVAGSLPPGRSFVNTMAEGVEQGALIVLASGNSGREQPDYPARYAGDFSGPGQVIAVGAVDDNNRIAGFSNRAGDKKNFFMVAPGKNVDVLNTDGSVEKSSGTSYAAPLVSGAAAILLQQAPHLSGRQMADILLQTATDLGDSGVDEIYGWGLLNVGRALEPYGISIIPSSIIVDEEVTDYNQNDNAVVYFDTAVAPALSGHAALSEVMSLDSYGRPYVLDLRELSQRQTYSPDLLQWLSADEDQRRSFAVQNGFGTGRLSYGTDGNARLRGDGSTFVRFEQTFANGAQLTAGSGQALGAQFGLTALGGAEQATLSRHGADNPYLALAGETATLAAAQSYMNGRLSLSAGAAFGGSDPIGELLAENTAVADYAAGSAVAEARYLLVPSLQLSATLGHLAENGAFLNSRGVGPLALPGAQTQFAALSGRYEITPTLALTGTYSHGRTRPDGNIPGLVRDFSNVRSEAFSVGLHKQGLMFAGSEPGNWQDRLSLSLSQPLRVTSGELVLDVPLARDNDGNITRTRETVSLAPDGRQLDLELSYDLIRQRMAGRRDSLSLLAGYTSDPGHDSRAKPVSLIGIRFRRAF